MKARWLPRGVALPGPCLCLCFSEDEFKRAVSRLKVAHAHPWINHGADATTHIYENDTGELVCIVCLGEQHTSRRPTQVAALLVHEAVHIWRHHCSRIGERQPGEEQEAYGIQFISEHLFDEYARRCSTKS